MPPRTRNARVEHEHEEELPIVADPVEPVQPPIEEEDGDEVIPPVVIHQNFPVVQPQGEDPSDNNDDDDEEDDENSSTPDGDNPRPQPFRRHDRNTTSSEPPRAHHHEDRRFTTSDLRDIVKAITTEISPSTKGTDVRAPDKFSGTDRTKFKTYVAQCRLVFRANPRKFDTDTKKVTYACSYLDGLAFQWYQNYLELDDEPLWFDNFRLFVKELREGFGEIDAQAAAERDIRLLSMRSSDNITTYITKFHTFANLLEWNDTALVSEFRRGLAGRIKDELVHVPKDHWTLKELQTASIKIDNRYWERQNEKTNERSYDRKDKDAKDDKEHGKESSNDDRNKRHDRHNNKKRPRYNKDRSPRSNDSSKPDLPLNREGKVTNEEKQRRIDLKLCAYCGGKHKFEDCTIKPKANEKARQAVTTFTVQGNE
jgi:FtsZ-interacting cell division protein YlmF